MTIVEQRQKEMINIFQTLGGWQARYKHIIAMGKELPEMPKSLYQDQFLVKGCQSQVWLQAQRRDNGHVQLFADSDALIVKGLVALLLQVYSEAPAQDIVHASPSFFETLGFQEALSPSRANGFLAMMKQIHLYATAFQLMDTP